MAKKWPGRKVRHNPCPDNNSLMVNDLLMDDLHFILGLDDGTIPGRRLSTCRDGLGTTEKRMHLLGFLKRQRNLELSENYMHL